MRQKHKKWTKLPKKFHFLQHITPTNAAFLEYLDDYSLKILLKILNDIMHQRIELKSNDLAKTKKIIYKHNIFFRKLNKAKCPISFFKQQCSSHPQIGRGIGTLIAAIAPALISLVQGLFSR